jgi:hypothetical protein
VLEGYQGDEVRYNSDERLRWESDEQEDGKFSWRKVVGYVRCEEKKRASEVGVK